MTPLPLPQIEGMGREREGKLIDLPACGIMRINLVLEASCLTRPRWLVSTPVSGIRYGEKFDSPVGSILPSKCHTSDWEKKKKEEKNLVSTPVYRIRYCEKLRFTSGLYTAFQMPYFRLEKRKKIIFKLHSMCK